MQNSHSTTNIQTNHTIPVQEHYPLHIINLTSLFISLSILGVLIRLGLILLFSFEASPLNAFAIPQILGCALHGIFYKHPFLLKYPDIYIGLTVGLNGSITSFSSWMNSVALEFINYYHWHRPIFSSILSGFLQIGVIYALCFGSFVACHQAMDKTESTEEPFWFEMFVKRVKMTRIIVFCSGIILLLWISLMIIFINEREIWIAALLGPLGTGLRYYLSRWNQSNSTSLSFYGTLMANALGCLIVALLNIGKWKYPIDSVGFLLVSSIADGFCGCLTTISTWIGELWTLNGRHRWNYAFISITSGLTPILLILLILNFTF